MHSPRLALACCLAFVSSAALWPTRVCRTGPTFLIEYAQDRNNTVGHVHTVLRDFNGDFGGEIRAAR